MSTIASPRDPSRRVPPISTGIQSSSTRPSLDSPTGPTSRFQASEGLRSSSASPSRGPPSQSQSPAPAPTQRNRAALREYYNLKAQEQNSAAGSDAGSEAGGRGNSGAEGSEFGESEFGDSEVQEGEMDRTGFQVDEYVKRVLEKENLEELLRVYGRVLSDIRALTAEKKSLVYDNYSKLISATDTISRMRANMDPLNPMASTLDPAIAHIYETASKLKQALAKSMTEADSSPMTTEQLKERNKAILVARRVLDTPRRIQELVDEGKVEEAEEEWAPVRAVLEKWRDLGEGGQDVQECLERGELALKGASHAQASKTR